MGFAEIKWACTEAPLPTDNGKRSPTCLAVLKCFAEHISNGGSAFLSYESIMEETALGESTIRKCIARLLAAGCIKEVAPPHGYTPRAFVLLINVRVPAGSATPPESPPALPGSPLPLPGGPKRTTKEDLREVLRTSPPTTSVGGAPREISMYRPDDDLDGVFGNRWPEESKPQPVRKARTVSRNDPWNVALSKEFRDSLWEVKGTAAHDTWKFAMALAKWAQDKGVAADVIRLMMKAYFANPQHVLRLGGRKRACWDFLGQAEHLHDRAVSLIPGEHDLAPEDILSVQEVVDRKRAMMRQVLQGHG